MSNEQCAKKEELIRHLLASGCLKFGQFTLKSGATSSYYIDLRESTMYPTIFQRIVELIKSLIPKSKQSADWQEASQKSTTAIVGVPYGVVPVAAAVAYECKMVYYPVRKEAKEYGSKPDMSLYSNYEFILVEDVMSSGSSIIETIKKLADKKVTDVIVVVNRESGGEENLKAEYPDMRLHYVLRASELLKWNKDKQ